MSASCLNNAVALVCALALAMAHSSTTAVAQDTPKDFLLAHNRVRAEVNVPDVVWDDVLANYAYGRAVLCDYTHAGGSYGENLFWGWGKEYVADDAVTSWVSEKVYYNCWSNSCAGGRYCGHYTQVVWQNTTWIGCARALCPADSIPGVKGPVYYFVCNYDPVGNTDGKQPYNCTGSSNAFYVN